MGTNLSVANDRESSPDPWWPDSRSRSTNVTVSVNPKPADSQSEEQRHREELAVAVAAAVASSAGVSTSKRRISDKNVAQDENHLQEDGHIFENDIRHEENQKKLELFKQELATKREARQKAIAALNDKLKQLQEQVKTEEQARINAENEVVRLKELLAEGGLKEELEKERSKVKNLEIELENEKKLRLELEKEKEDVQEKEEQIHALREVASIGKEMLRIRELQVNELKKKLCETQYPEDLREEYEAQIQNVRRLKTLYEERAEAVRLEHQREIEREMARIRVLESKISELEHERKEAEVMREHLKDRVLKLDQELEERNDAAMALQEQLDASVIECRDLASQMSLINNLFSQMLVGNLNLDRITRLVEENQSLVIDLTTDDKKNDLAALLIDIAKQLDEDETVSNSTEGQNNNEEQQSSINSNLNNNGPLTQQDVALNLSKVWRILVQLLTTQDQGSSTPPPSECDSESCYKSVETPSGKRSVISVSQTFLTLKNLILEKNALIKEVNKLKLLNEHLETRLGNQEKRLSTVSTELKKTWGVVSKLRVQHKQLHTQEKILKYELQHKRLLLNDLKDELERCKEIWDMARQKNCQSEEEWRKLRKEFADRRKNTDINNSAESGYEDDESNTPPTEESIDEQELDRLIDPDNDSILLMNEELSGSTAVFINDISNPDDSHDDQQNDSDHTIEFLDSDNRVLEESAGLEHRSSSTVKSDSEENRMHSQKEKDEVLTLDVPVSEVTEINKESVKDTRLTKPSKSPVTDTTAENISRFLEGLLASDDVSHEDNDTVSKKTNEQNTFVNETCNSVSIDSSTDCQIKDNPSVAETFPESAHSEVQNSNSDSNVSHISSFESCSTVYVKESCDHETERSSLETTTLKDERSSPDLLVENHVSDTESRLQNSNDETDTSNSLSFTDDKNNQIDDDSGKLDEACGYSPTYCIAQSTCLIPSVNEMLELCTTNEPAALCSLTSQSDKKPNENRTTEEVLDARTERLKRLEEQCKSLFNKVTATTIKSNVLSSKLELLHEQYGRSSESYDDINTSTTTSTINRQDGGDDDDDKNIDSETGNKER